MGIITRSAANNITTGGVILPAGINDASVASITALAQVSTGDGITLISSQTASASASIDFTSGIDSTYRTYMFKFINMHPSAESYLTFQMNASGQTGFNETITSAAFRAYHTEADADGFGYQTTRDQAQGTSYQLLTEPIRTGADESCSGYLMLFNPSSATFVKHFISRVNSVTDNTYSVDNYYAGYFNTTSSLDEISFKFSSGNIDAGTIYMYGIA